MSYRSHKKKQKKTHNWNTAAANMGINKSFTIWPVVYKIKPKLKPNIKLSQLQHIVTSKYCSFSMVTTAIII